MHRRTMFIAATIFMFSTSNANADSLYLDIGTSWNYSKGTEYYGTEWMGEYEGGYQFTPHQFLKTRAKGRLVFYAEHTSSVPDMEDSGQNMAGVKYRLEMEL